MSRAMSLKAKIRNIAKQKKLKLFSDAAFLTLVPGIFTMRISL